MGKIRYFGLALGAILSLTGCNAHDAGTFSTHFIWPDGAEPVLEGAWVQGRVEERPEDVLIPGRVLDSLSHAYESGVKFSFRDIKNGDKRVVLVEIREGKDPANRILYYGISEWFSLEAGRHTDVPVLLQLNGVPGGGATNPLGGVDVSPAIGGNSDVSLLLTTDTGVSARISNSIAFASNYTQTISLSEEILDSANNNNTKTYKTEWDLDLGFETPCQQEEICERRVYVRFVDAQDYESATFSGDAVIDKKAPQALPDATLMRTPIFVAAIDSENDTVFFSARDIFTGDQVRASLYVYSDELIETASLAATSSSHTLDFGGAEITGRLAHFNYSILEDDPDGAYSFELTWSDIYGNTATRLLEGPTLQIDTSVPSSGAMNMSKITYTRIPWGAEETGGTPRFSLRGEEGAINSTGHKSALVIAFRSENDPAVAHIGNAQILSDGSFEIASLNGGNLPSVYLRSASRAGVLSDPRLVPNIEWVASMGGKIAGQEAGNPNIYKTADMTAGRRLFEQDANEPENASVLSLVSGDTVTHGSTREGWGNRVLNNTHPIATGGFAITEDLLRERVVLFGGYSDYGTPGYADVWEWDGFEWKQITIEDPEADGNPLARFGASMTCDTKRNRVLLFGGGSINNGENITFNDLWEWNGKSWRLLKTNAPEDTTQPSPRIDHTISYDSSRDVIVLFGGRASSSGFDHNGRNDIWEWNGESWSEIIPNHIIDSPETPPIEPGPRAWHEMSYDSVRQKTLLFGGQTSCCSTTMYGDLWEWDGSSWTLLHEGDPTGSSAPIARSSFAQTFDQEEGRLVVFGGKRILEAGGSTTVPPPAWAWDGSEWSEIATYSTSPSIRGGSGAAYDAKNKSVLLYGGGYINPYYETYMLYGDIWTQLPPSFLSNILPEAAPARAYAQIVHDRVRGESIAFGGQEKDSYSNDTWVSLSDYWLKAATTGPPARQEHAMVYDEFNESVVLFGGYIEDAAATSSAEDIWQWNGIMWTEIFPDDPEADGDPGPRRGATLVWDSIRETALLFGGIYHDGSDWVYPNDLWEWNGSSWKELIPTNSAEEPLPNGRNLHAAVFDRHRGKMVVYGGSYSENSETIYSNELWEWDESHWDEITPTDPEGDGNPLPRFYHSMVYDEITGLSKIFSGGEYNDIEVIDTTSIWDWNGQSWRKTPTPEETTDHPYSRYNQSAWWNDSDKSIALYGGFAEPNTGNPLYERSWSFGSAPTQPSQVLHANFENSAHTDDFTINSVSTQWFASSTQTQIGTASPRPVILSIWQNGQWQDVTTVATDAGLSDVNWESNDQEYLSNILYGNNEYISFSLRPNTDRTVFSSIDVSYAEIRVHYSITAGE